ncbi:hypothetical protein D2A86_11720 [Enterococcus faecalis]|uniref:hypothetical protein n=1 Tax=Enterococcus faecalis TaxID=1351 RepID=UPI000DEB5068|nr:hypothetical protein [Enterococcus faecalis]EGO6537150.1 hypothetical protein [Enterococcus faecalis]EGO7933229.1 hypothetical protein [Enterococcus faecalis]EGO8763375.1 hypothetical protein [Enterococcus faecalis]EGO9005507.1 hypothetical protein [Enterococcus faecalis]EGO9160906.1 hypothetical protein [Enterococcus faecalis]
MAVEVEILTSNVEILAKQPPLELLPFSDFLEITQYMEKGETVTFQLLEVAGEPFYKGTFTKMSEEYAFEEDIRKKLNQVIKQKKMSAEQAESLLEKLSFTTVQETLPLSVKQKFLEKKKEKSEKVMIQKKKPERRVPRLSKVSLPSFFVSWKKIGIGVLIFSCIGLSAFFFLKNDTSVAKKDTSYEQLFQEGNYQQLLKKYPEKEQTLIEQLYQEGNEKGLEEVAKQATNNLAQFYLSFYRKDWEKVTTLKELPQEKDVLAMKGYAFLKQDKLEEAKLINEAIKNETLTQQIEAYELTQAYKALREGNVSTAEKINKEIANKQLSDDISVVKSILNLMKKYAEDKENKKLSEAERKEAQQNYDDWKKNLQQIGEESTFE